MKWWTNLVDAIGTALGESHFNTMVNRRAKNIHLLKDGKVMKSFANEKEEATFWASEEGQAWKEAIDKYETK